jgi:DNA-binding PadR family transcriptional regulator
LSIRAQLGLLLDNASITSYDITRYVLIVSDPTLLVLASLADGEKHGYAMMEDIQRFAGVRLGPGTLYGAITRLEERGWIRALESEDRRRPYAITGAGKQYLEEQLATLDQVVKTAMRRLRPA